MNIEFNIIKQIEDEIKNIAISKNICDRSFTPNVIVSKLNNIHYQINGIISYAKLKEDNVNKLASNLISAVEKEKKNMFFNQLTMRISGNGFINILLNDNLMIKWIKKYKNYKHFLKKTYNNFINKKIIVDYSSPNIAKNMHVGHLRSITIGNFIVNLLKFLGGNVLSDNHIGDWGTQFGVLIYEIKKTNLILKNNKNLLNKLENLYKKGNELFEKSTIYKNLVYSELYKLQNGDPINNLLWKKVIKFSYKLFNKIYKKMGVKFDMILGESFYKDKVYRVYNELQEINLAKKNNNALIVFCDIPYNMPFIIRKKDGTSNYATNDLAGILYHTEKNKANILIYVTDNRQKDHFKCLFFTIKQWFYQKKYEIPEMYHIEFGSVLGQNKKPMKTRYGDSITLADLINKSYQKSFNIINQKNPNLNIKLKKNIAKTIGIASIKYADLSQNRSSDYIFSFEKALSFEGNTAPYILYTIARLNSILKKVNKSELKFIEKYNFKNWSNDLEKKIAFHLTLFPSIIHQTYISFKPNILCNHIFNLTSIFSKFYSEYTILNADKNIRFIRLLLCKRILNQLKNGLKILGIKILKFM